MATKRFDVIKKTLIQ